MSIVEKGSFAAVGRCGCQVELWHVSALQAVLPPLQGWAIFYMEPPGSRSFDKPLRQVQGKLRAFGFTLTSWAHSGLTDRISREVIPGRRYRIRLMMARLFEYLALKG